jgi:hypothetical protein
MICGHSPERPWRDKPYELSQLCCHEIACGSGLRQKALDKPYAILVLCSWCNMYVVVNKGKWPQARQLAVLKEKDRESFDLVAFNELINPRAPNRITMEDNEKWMTNQK